MSRTPRTGVGRITIELDLSDPAQALVWEHWQSLTRKGEASRWGREVLQKGLPLLNIKHPKTDNSKAGLGVWVSADGAIRTASHTYKESASKQLRVSDEPVYEDIE